MALGSKQRIKKEQSTVFAYSFKPLHLNINNYILLTFLLKFRMVQIRRILLTIRSF